MPPNTRTPLRAEGGRIVVADGDEVLITGVNWFGLETQTFAPHGLDRRKWTDLLDQIVSLGFNALRLPFSTQLLHPEISVHDHDVDANLTSNRPSGIDLNRNPDLAGLTGPAIMDKVVEGATDRGLMVILDRHRLNCVKQCNLWHDGDFSEDVWIQDWAALAHKYRNIPLVIGADLHNEPHDHREDKNSQQPSATWGDGNPDTDWRLGAERAGERVLQANQDWLIFVEGVGSLPRRSPPEVQSDDSRSFNWDGGHLAGVRDNEVRLDRSRVVYSPHEYGKGVHFQPWLKEESFPVNMPCRWEFMWAYLVHQDRAPVLVGEFGGKSVDVKTNEGLWQQALVRYLKDNRVGYTYFCLNPNSDDTGGVLEDDFSSVRKDKMDLLPTHEAPRLTESSRG